MSRRGNNGESTLPIGPPSGTLCGTYDSPSVAPSPTLLRITRRYPEFGASLAAIGIPKWIAWDVDGPPMISRGNHGQSSLSTPQATPSRWLVEAKWHHLLRLPRPSAQGISAPTPAYQPGPSGPPAPENLGWPTRPLVRGTEGMGGNSPGRGAGRPGLVSRDWSFLPILTRGEMKPNLDQMSQFNQDELGKLAVTIQEGGKRDGAASTTRFEYVVGQKLKGLGT